MDSALRRLWSSSAGHCNAREIPWQEYPLSPLPLACVSFLASFNLGSSLQCHQNHFGAVTAELRRGGRCGSHCRSSPRSPSQAAAAAGVASKKNREDIRIPSRFPLASSSTGFVLAAGGSQVLLGDSIFGRFVLQQRPLEQFPLKRRRLLAFVRRVDSLPSVTLFRRSSPALYSSLASCDKRDTGKTLRLTHSFYEKELKRMTR